MSSNLTSSANQNDTAQGRIVLVSEQNLNESVVTETARDVILNVMRTNIWPIVILLALAAAVAGLFGYQWSELQWAHSSFDSYYAFRGCVQLIDKTDTYGDCRTADGQTIKIVLYQGKWYLNGDLPGCFLGLCL